MKTGIQTQTQMRFCIFVCCCLLIGSCVGESLSAPSPSAASSSPAVQPRILASDPHAVRRNRIKDKPSSPEEYIAVYDRFLSRNTRLNEKLEDMFKAWDANRDGVLSQHEINQLCEHSVLSPTEYDMLMSFDVDNSGSVDHTEFKLGPLFVNALEHDKERNEAFNEAASKHDESFTSSPRFATKQTDKLEPLGQHVLDARKFFRDRLGLDQHPLTAAVLPLSSKLLELSHLATSVASDLPPSSMASSTPPPTTTSHTLLETNDDTEVEVESDPALSTPATIDQKQSLHTPAILLSLSEKITQRAKSKHVDLVDGLDDTLRMPDLITTPDHSSLESLLSRVETNVKKTINSHGSEDDLSRVSFEKPTLDNLDEWVDKAKDIMYKLKQKKIGEAVEDAIPQAKFIEEKWRVSNLKAAEERKRQKAHPIRPSSSYAQRVRAHRHGIRSSGFRGAAGATPMTISELEIRSASQQGSRMHGGDPSRFGRWNRKSRGDTGRVIGKEFYPTDHQPAGSVEELRQRRDAAEQQSAMTQQMVAPQTQMGGMNYDGQPTPPTDSSLLQRQQVESTEGQQIQSQAKTDAQIVQQGEDILKREGFAPDDLRLQQEKDKAINLGGSLGASIGGSIGGSVSLGGAASIGGSIGGSLSVGAKASASIGGSASVSTPAPAAKPQVKITTKPVAPTGDGLPTSKYGVPSYNDERCVLCQFLVQRTEANLFKRMLIVLDSDRQNGISGVGRNSVTMPQPATDAAPGSSTAGATAISFHTTTAAGGGATGTTGYIWDVLSRAYSGAGQLDVGLWMDPTDPNNVDSTSEPLSDYVMKDVIRHVGDYTDGRGHGIVRYTAEDTLSDFCAEDNVPELFYAYCPDFWSALPTIVDALYFGFHGDATCEEAQMCGSNTYFNTQNAVHLPNKSRYFNAGRGLCGLTGGARERKRGGKLLSATCVLSKVLGKF